MLCSRCSGQLDDPFWDEYCPECEHDIMHRNFDPSCIYCCSEQETRPEDEEDFYEPATAAKST
jgi:hypothetical protein